MLANEDGPRSLLARANPAHELGVVELGGFCVVGGGGHARWESERVDEWASVRRGVGTGVVLRSERGDSPMSLSGMWVSMGCVLTLACSVVSGHVLAA
jgi:hypothetical protein